LSLDICISFRGHSLSSKIFFLKKSLQYGLSWILIWQEGLVGTLLQRDFIWVNKRTGSQNYNGDFSHFSYNWIILFYKHSAPPPLPFTLQIANANLLHWSICKIFRYWWEEKKLICHHINTLHYNIHNNALTNWRGFHTAWSMCSERCSHSAVLQNNPVCPTQRFRRLILRIKLQSVQTEWESLGWQIMRQQLFIFFLHIPSSREKRKKIRIFIQ